MHADRVNRVMLTVFGLLLLIAGGCALAASFGAFGDSISHRVLTDNVVSDFFSDQGEWLWPVIAGGCALLAIACLRWIVALLGSTDRAGDLTVSAGADEDRNGGDGTTLRPAALIGALTTEVSSYRGVDSAKGRVIGDGRDPEVVLTVTTAPTADLNVLHHRIEDEAFAHARRAVGNPSLPIHLELA